MSDVAKFVEQLKALSLEEIASMLDILARLVALKAKRHDVEKERNQ